jgi:hypothetical protein
MIYLADCKPKENVSLPTGKKQSYCIFWVWMRFDGPTLWKDIIKLYGNVKNPGKAVGPDMNHLLALIVPKNSPPQSALLEHTLATLG